MIHNLKNKCTRYLRVGQLNNLNIPNVWNKNDNTKTCTDSNILNLTLRPIK